MAKHFWWTAQRLQALELELQGHKTEEIAAAVGTTVPTIQGWRRRDPWQERRRQLDEAALAALRRGYAENAEAASLNV